MSTQQMTIPGEGAWMDMLRAIPLPNEAARVEPGGSGTGVRISVPARKRRWQVVPITWLIRLRPRKTYELDPTGTFIWENCDGQRTVEALIEMTARRYDLSFHESRVAVNDYLRMLIKRGILAVKVSGKPAGYNQTGTTA